MFKWKHVGKNLSYIFPIHNVWLFIAIKLQLCFVTKKDQENRKGLKLNGTQHFPVCADVNLSGKNKHRKDKHRHFIEHWYGVRSGSKGTEKQAYFLLHHQNFENSADFKYGKMTLTHKNSFHEIIKGRMLTTIQFRNFCLLLCYLET